MMRYITAAQMAKVDRLMINHYKISLLQMMENAGIRLAEFAQKFVGVGCITVVCGPGNNGGGGLAAARHLHIKGSPVTVILHGKKLKHAPAHQLASIKKIGISVLTGSAASRALDTSDLIIDALLGYNLKGPPRGSIATLVSEINKSAAKVLALDIPTGINATTGEQYNPHVKADATVTLALPKTGLKKLKKVFVANISVPRELYKRVNIPVIKNMFQQHNVIPIPKFLNRGSI